jgi:hypothetical protein
VLKYTSYYRRVTEELAQNLLISAVMALSMTTSAQRNEIIDYVVSKLTSLDEVMHFQLCQRTTFLTSPPVPVKNGFA